MSVHNDNAASTTSTHAHARVDDGEGDDAAAHGHSHLPAAASAASAAAAAGAHGHGHGHAHGHHGGLSAAAVNRRYMFGLLLLLFVVLLWVGSSALIQSIFVDSGFRAPFFLTYYSTSLFVLYLPAHYGRQWATRRGWIGQGRWTSCCRCCRSQKARMREGATLLRDPADPHAHAAIATAAPAAADEMDPEPHTIVSGHTNGLGALPAASASTLSLSSESSVDSTDALLPTSHAQRPASASSLAATHPSDRRESFDTHQIASPRLVDVEAANDSLDLSSSDDASTGVPWTLRQHIHLACWLSPVWFCMNFFFNVSLELTSISSSTILATTSSLFVLLFTRLLDPATPILTRQVLGVAVTIAGATIISWRDGSGGGSDAAGGTAAAAELPHKMLGDLLAAGSAVFYGLYSVSLRLRCPADDSLFSMEIVFGFLGLINLLVMWPLFFVLDASGLERFGGVPPGEVMLFLTINGLLGTVVSDFLWARSVLLTSPLIASLGLSLTIPLAVLFDLTFHSLRFSISYLLGGLCVIAGFALVNLVHSQEIKQEEQQEQLEQQQQQQHDDHANDGLTPTAAVDAALSIAHADALEDVDLDHL